MRLPILRSSPEDQILYQTERYNEDTFGYDIPIREEGDYILVMKYAEVYFAQSQQKVWQLMNLRCSSVVCVFNRDVKDVLICSSPFISSMKGMWGVFSLLYSIDGTMNVRLCVD